MEDENKEVKRTSKLSSLMNQKTEDLSALQITVYYSENNWETCEEVNLILDDTTTINQLIDSSIYKFKTELSYENIDKKQFQVKLFKKKTKKPNEDYPICNPESKVKDYGKTHFCLIEETNSNINENSKNEEKSKNLNENNIEINNQNLEIISGNDGKNDKNQKDNKKCGCLSCGIF
jgi:hypothetical protein